MKKKLFLVNIFLVFLMSSTMVFGIVPTNDIRSYKEEIKGAKQATEELKKETDAFKTSVQSLMNVGPLLDGLLDTGFLFPSKKPKATEDVKRGMSSSQKAGSGGVADQAKAAKNSLTGGSSGESETPFGSRSEVDENVKKMQVRDDASSDPSGGSVLDTAKSTVASATGKGGENGLTGQDVYGKRQKMPQTKQAWARYAMATALVNRSLAYRTSNDSKKQTTEQVSNVQNMREAHTAKTHGYAAMASSYNRLLLSQAVANGLSAFKSMDHVEGKINLSNPLMDGMGGKMNDLKGLLQ